MTLSFPNSATVKHYLPGLYFSAVTIWVSIEYQNLLMVLLMLPFVVQMILNNRYLNLVLGFLTILWSAYIAFIMFTEIERTFHYILIALSFTILNLYMSRMLFLNQNFTMAALRENSLDETLFI